MKTIIDNLKNEKKGVRVYPRTHLRAVRDDNGTTLDTLLDIQDEKLSELGSEVSNINTVINGMVFEGEVKSDRVDRPLIPINVSVGDELVLSSEGSYCYVYLRYYGGSSTHSYQSEEIRIGNGNTVNFTCDKAYDTILVQDTSAIDTILQVRKKNSILQSIEDSNRRIDEIETNVSVLSENVRTLGVSTKTIKENVDEINAELTGLIATEKVYSDRVDRPIIKGMFNVGEAITLSSDGSKCQVYFRFYGDSEDSQYQSGEIVIDDNSSYNFICDKDYDTVLVQDTYGAETILTIKKEEYIKKSISDLTKKTDALNKTLFGEEPVTGTANTNRDKVGPKFPYKLEVGDKVVIKNLTDNEGVFYLRFYGENAEKQYQYGPVTIGAYSEVLIESDNVYDCIYFYETYDKDLTFEAYNPDNKSFSEAIKKYSSSSIFITNGTANSFDVHVFSDSLGVYLRHKFVRMYHEKELSYGNGNTKTMVTCNCWYPEDIFDEDGNKLVQGNVNFINNIYPYSEVFNGEGYYVGEAHGCAIAVYTKFYADGKEVNPTLLGNGRIECETFRFVEKVNYYADNLSLSANSLSYPKVDNNGNLILANVHFADALYERNNKITTINRLTVKRDGTIFRSIFAGMSRVYSPYFKHVILNDADNTANGFVYDEDNGSWIVTDEGDNGVLLNDSNKSYLKGSNVILYGDKYFYEQTIEQRNRPFSSLNYRNQFYNDAVKSFKVYQLPALCKEGEPYIGENAEVFNKGDVIECVIVRKIDGK